MGPKPKKTIKSKIDLFQSYLPTEQKNVNPFICGICNFSTKRKSDLTQHTKSVHLNLKPFECDVCKNCFAQKQNLKNHKINS